MNGQLLIEPPLPEDNALVRLTMRLPVGSECVVQADATLALVSSFKDENLPKILGELFAVAEIHRASWSADHQRMRVTWLAEVPPPQVDQPSLPSISIGESRTTGMCSIMMKDKSVTVLHDAESGLDLSTISVPLSRNGVCEVVARLMRAIGVVDAYQVQESLQMSHGSWERRGLWGQRWDGMMQ